MRPGTLTFVILGFVAFVTSFGAHVVAVNLPAYAAQVGVGVAGQVCTEKISKVSVRTPPPKSRRRAATHP